jgi:single-strand DNA-binding protein
MASYNKVLLMGNLTRDPEVRYTPKGTAVATIGVAVNRVWMTETGEKKEEVTFVDVDVWGRQAETIGQYLTKGRPIFIEGRLRLDQWDDKESGQKRSKLRVVCERFQFLGAPKGGAGSSQFSDEPPGKAQRPGRAAPAPPEEEPPPAEADDNIPF